ncbi:probable G-protein coupled receptor 141 [Seriola lalandi dorsalis]|uniref:G protein-coupled receptor 141 n=1 Tax=Seriola lalandi dorsalis TaxID=1841481 RepID=A0A3B4X788_SERLL|nr:probable G-protein coupled receptor 141 [Seriola lalandi dorsalis]
MNCTVAQNTLSAAINSTDNSTAQSSNIKLPPEYHMILLGIYSVVLVSGTISLSLMMHILKSSSTSSTSIAVLNLIFAHFIFLITVPFRIYYHVAQKWHLGKGLCKVISGMIHIHMYMSFIFYVIILITRLMTFYHKAGQLASFQRIHALVVSALVWLVVLIMVPCIIHFSYGQKSSADAYECFHFGLSIHSGAKVFNYIISTMIIVVATVLTALQASALRVLYRKHQGCTSQQDFGAQQKSLCFALIMVVCFIPYHMFRLYYVANINNENENINEVFLSLTTFNCLDMLTFLGRRTCYTCFLRNLVCE